MCLSLWMVFSFWGLHVEVVCRAMHTIRLPTREGPEIQPIYTTCENLQNDLKKAGPLHRISDGHPAYSCLHCVLPFPYREDV